METWILILILAVVIIPMLAVLVDGMRLGLEFDASQDVPFL